MNLELEEMVVFRTTTNNGMERLGLRLDLLESYQEAKSDPDAAHHGPKLLVYMVGGNEFVVDEDVEYFERELRALGLQLGKDRRASTCSKQPAPERT